VVFLLKKASGSACPLVIVNGNPFQEIIGTEMPKKFHKELKMGSACRLVIYARQYLYI